MKNDILDFDLGSHSFKVSTVSADAQRLFDLGLNWCFGFNQEEGVTCFKKALEYDPTCAMLRRSRPTWGLRHPLGIALPPGSYPLTNKVQCALTWRGSPL